MWPSLFYEDFVLGIQEVLTAGGVTIGNHLVPVSFRCCIVDAPARAFGLNHWNHNSANACSKCKVGGHRCAVPGFERTIAFLGVDHQLRTDAEFANIVVEDHHKGWSPLSGILKLVTRVPFELMHSGYLGNVKKAISAHLTGQFGFRGLHGKKQNILNSIMKTLASYYPSEFNSRTEEFTLFVHYKATQLRQFLLYTAPVIFKDAVSHETARDMYPFCQDILETYV